MKVDSEILDITWLEKLGMDILKMGAIPKHIAIILDGNRRFARKKGFGDVTKGHLEGSKKVQKMVDLLLYLGVKELTVYAFSIDNLKRPAEEVAGLMGILHEKLKQEASRLCEKGVCVNFFGNLDQVTDPEVRRAIEKTMVMTKDNTRFKLNVALIYAGRNEITQGLNELFKGLHDGKLLMGEIKEELLQETFSLHPVSPVDILIRTSGETRLSDFLTWSGSDARFEFVQRTWPELRFWDFLQIILEYQRIFKNEGFGGNGSKGNPKAEKKRKEEERSENFLKKIRTEQWNEMLRRTEKLF